MAGTAISYNSNSLQTSTIITSNIDHHSSPDANARVIQMAHANATAIPYVDWPKKIVSIQGQLLYTSSLAALDQLEDTFKGYLTAQNAYLDVGYAGSTRRYTVLATTKVAISRPQELYSSKFDVEFTCQPWGMDTSATTLVNLTGQTSSSVTMTPTFGGTFPYQYPIYTITPTSITSSSTNLCTNPGFETNTTGWSSGGIGTFTRVTTQFHSGVASGQMVNASSSPQSSPVANTYGFEVYSISGLTAGSTYNVTMWAKGNAGGEAFGTETISSALTNATLTTSWQQVSFTFTAGSTTDQLYVFSTTASATWFIDDVTISPLGSGTISIGNNSTGQQVNITRVWLPNDVLVVDTTQLLNTAPGASNPVTVNGLPVSYTGALPEFPPGASSITYTDSFLNRSVNLLITNQNRYM